MPLTPQGFVSKWKRAEGRERQSVQEHFIDLCGLIGQVPPMQAASAKSSSRTAGQVFNRSYS